MNIYLEKVKEFMLTFGQPVLDKPTPLAEDRQKLRIALIFEELKEYAEASGMTHYFNELNNKSLLDSEYSTNLTSKDFNLREETECNEVEQLDALLDLQYVLSGAVHEHGFGEIFDKGFEEVHDSNMSKVCQNDEIAFRTQKKYKEQGIETIVESLDNKFNGKNIIKRLSDMKVLKSDEYKPAQLSQFLEPQKSQLLVYLTFKGIDDWHRAIFKDKTSSSYYGDSNCNKTGKPEDVINYYKNNIDKLEYFGEHFNCEPHGGLNSNIKLIIE